MPDPVKDVILSVIESSLEAQLKAVRKLRRNDGPAKPISAPRRSQLDIVKNILDSSSKPLHISDILEAAQRDYGVTLDRDSVVSSLSKKVARQDTFQRTDKSTFTLIRQGAL